MPRINAVLAAFAVLSATGYNAESGPLGPEGVSAPTVDTRTILVPPPAFPARDDAFVTQTGDGESTLTRSQDGARAEAELRSQEPGHALFYVTITFNYPEHCREGENRLPEPGPCRGNGPADPRDGLSPEVQVSADVWASALASPAGVASFQVDLSHDIPIQKINDGPGIVNPEGAVIDVYVMDKGPLAPEGPLRGAQMNSLYGGCQGPPAFGPLPCRGVAIVQHLPASP
jgi:hypothetical protein